MSTVWDKLEANAYRNKAPYPEKPRKPFLSKNATADEFRRHADALEAYDQAMVGYRAEVAEYNRKTAELESEFQEDLEAYYEMKGHPKAGLLYWKAYERGHSGGMSEVANEYSDLVELVK